MVAKIRNSVTPTIQTEKNIMPIGNIWQVLGEIINFKRSTKMHKLLHLFVCKVSYSKRSTEGYQLNERILVVWTFFKVS